MPDTQIQTDSETAHRNRVPHLAPLSPYANPYAAADLSGLYAAGLSRGSVWITWIGLWMERLTVAFWPLATVGITLLAVRRFALAFDGPMLTTLMAVLVLLAAVAAIAGLMRFRRPDRGAVLARLDGALLGSPILALLDDPAMGAHDPAAAALWQAHQARMRAAVTHARAVGPQAVSAPLDPFALRLNALLLLGVSFVIMPPFTAIAPTHGAGTGAVGAVSSWEGWIEPPAYTRLPTLYLADQADGPVDVPAGSALILRVYNDDNTITLDQDVATPAPAPTAADAALPDGLREERLMIHQSGRLQITTDTAPPRRWTVRAVPDQPPTLMRAAAVQTEFDGQMTLSFAATDDYGVTSGMAEVRLDRAALDRIPGDRLHGLSLPPEQDSPWQVDLPLVGRNDWQDFEQDWVEDFSQHPWAHLPVEITLSVTDAQSQQASAEVLRIALPARRFFDPMAAALIEMRRDLLWNRANGPRVAQILRALSWRPEPKFLPQDGQYLQLRSIIHQLEAGLAPPAKRLSDVQRDDLAAALWDLALTLEEGDLDSARDRMLQAQERLSEAMRNGASDTEIAELMQELRQATRDYMRQLSQQAARDAEGDQDRDAGDAPSDAMELDMADLQAMMDRIEELMQQGRMAEAAQALQELQDLIDNMQMAEGQPQSGQGQQALDQLGDTLREQQGLSDQTFRELQEQFNPGANAGQSQQNEGRNGGQGRGQSHEGEGGQGQAQGEGQGQQGGTGGEGATGQSGQEDGNSLAQQQRALRDALERQLGALPGGDSAEGQAARDALQQAERAMEGAEERLRQDDLAGAIDQQAEALEQLREGLRNLGEALAQNGGQGQGQRQQGMFGNERDPLGRGAGQGQDRDLLRGERLNKRAQELQDQINRRSGETDRPAAERDYLDRLLDRF